MKKRAVCLAMLIILLVAGCQGFYEAMVEPESTQNKVADKVGEFADVVKDNAVLFGPAAGPVALVSTSIVSLVGWYVNKRKKLTISGQNVIIAGQVQKQGNLTMTLRSVIEAIDVIAKADAGPEGNAIKQKVKEQLQEHQVYQIGKAIISGLKSS